MKTEQFCAQPVTELPVFDLDLARQSAEEAFRLTTPYADCALTSLSSLQLAYALSLYNFENNVPTAQKDMFKLSLIDRLDGLARTELHTANPDNIFPTVGFEVETPLKPFCNRREIFGNSYRPFFDSIGMPRNMVNSDNHISSDAVEYWEFAPKPSFSANVQQRILSELIQGGFIPHLAFSQDPKGIQQHLDEHLVSLHINIGIPSDIDMTCGLPRRQAEVLGTALAIAYTSPLRIEQRKQKQTQFAQIKSGVPTLKSRDVTAQQYRVELKAMEARTPLTYRALSNAQLLFAALFSALSMEPDSELSYLSRQTIKGVQEISGYHFFYPNDVDPSGNNYEVARLTARGDTAHEMRAFLEEQAKEVKRYVSSIPQQPAEA